MADNGRVIYTARTRHRPPRRRPRPHLGRRDVPRAALRGRRRRLFRERARGAARPRRIEVGDVAIDSSVMLMPTDSRGYALSLTLAVTLPSIHRVEAVELVQ